MDNKHEIVICFGSSCFARGNKSLVRTIKDYLADNNLQNKVVFRGNHCFGLCSEGPVISINNKICKNMSEDNLIEALDNELHKLL